MQPRGFLPLVHIHCNPKASRSIFADLDLLNLIDCFASGCGSKLLALLVDLSWSPSRFFVCFLHPLLIFVHLAGNATITISYHIQSIIRFHIALVVLRHIEDFMKSGILAAILWIFRRHWIIDVELLNLLMFDTQIATQRIMPRIREMLLHMVHLFDCIVACIAIDWLVMGKG